MDGPKILSVAEFVRSGRLSSGAILSRREDEERPRADDAAGLRKDGGSQRHLFVENACRLASLLARSFSDSFESFTTGIGLQSVGLDDFLVSFADQPMDGEIDDGTLTFPPRYRGGAGQKMLILLGVDAKERGGHREHSVAIRGQATSRNDEMNSLSSQQLQQQQEAKSIKTLGQLLYCIFSEGGHPPADLFSTSTSFNQGNASTGERYWKTTRTSEATVFSRLAERSNAFPTSICRLLSDMFEAGLGLDVADSPFASMVDVLQDLEQMIAKPRAFLHDDPHFPHKNLTSPIFGQRHFGRNEKVSKLIRIATGMEQAPPQRADSIGPTEVVFVSGVAGAGKSYFVQSVAEHLSNLEWIVIKAKFERGKEYISRRVVSSLFDTFIIHLIEMREGGVPSEVAYCEKAAAAILDAVGRGGLSQLVDFLPSLPSLFEDDGDCFASEGGTSEAKGTLSEEGLAFSLSRILEAILKYDKIVFCFCDDLQWADKTSLSLITKFLINVSGIEAIRGRCLFVGSYRDNAIGDDHPFVVERSLLRASKDVNTTEIELSSLSTGAVVDMLMMELRLPCRMVEELANAVHKKTSGHVYFVVELLNSLVRDSTIVYNTQKRRYDWDQDVITIMPISNTVAELIAVNLSYLPPAVQRVLQILSCFGTQTDVDLLQILEGFQIGIISMLDSFLEKGILDRAGPLVIFAHDLIHQEIYEGMSEEERLKMHLEIGQFLGEQLEPATIGMDQLRLDDRLFYSGRRSMTSSLLSLACDQINSAGPDHVGDTDQRQKFAELNLAAGRKCSRELSFRAALYYFSKGIAFLGDDSWLTCAALSRTLREGAVKASFALGEFDGVSRHAEEVIMNSTFEDALEVQQVFLRSLSGSGRHEECISRGVEILRRLNFVVEESPSRESILKAVQSTDDVIVQCSLDRIKTLCEMVPDGNNSSQNIVKILDAFFVSSYSMGSLAWPLIACAICKYSLIHGICSESATAFAAFGTFKIFLQGDFSMGQYMATVARAITTKHQTMNKSKIPRVENRADILLYHTIDVWWMSPRDISINLLKYHHDAMKCGQIDVAMFALRQSWRFKLLGGESLPLILQSAKDRLKLIAKHSKHSAKHGLLDDILLRELTGMSWDSFSLFGGSINNMGDLEAEAVSSKDNLLLFTVHLYNVMIAFWRGEYEAAEESSSAALKIQPTAKMPSLYLICHTFFRGLVAFQLYRKIGAIGNDQRLAACKETMDEMKKWNLNCMAVFQNKLLLLKAEYFASVNDNDSAERLYIQSIDVSRDHGNIHELGLGYELLGKHYLAHGHTAYSNHCFKQAHKFYTQWGATAVAERILQGTPDLDIASADDAEVQIGKSSKHARQRDR